MNNWIARRLLLNAPNDAGATPPPNPTSPPETTPTDSAPADAGSLLENPPTEAPAEAAPEAEAPAPLTAEDITIPEGFAVDDTTLGSALEIMNDADLSPKDRLQKLVDLQASLAKSAEEAQAAAWTDTQNQWREEVQSDPELGGAKMGEVLARIKKGLEIAGADQGFFDAMKLTGAGNHPAVLRVLNKLTLPLAERGPVSGSPPNGKLSVEARLYPTMTKQE